MDSTQRFTTRVENYVKYRPHYPAEALRIIREECGLTPDWVVADVGSGTGISTELFLGNGNPTFAVEPNDAMRQAAETSFRSTPGFTSVNGTAEATTLPDNCVDLIVAGQAFHWFDPVAARCEFERILKPGGFVALMWNGRALEQTPFMAAYEGLMVAHCEDYLRVRNRNVDPDRVRAFFDPFPFSSRVCANHQGFDFEGLRGRLLSSSYAPEPGHPDYEATMQALRTVFDAYNQDGLVRFDYDTQVNVGRLR